MSLNQFENISCLEKNLVIYVSYNLHFEFFFSCLRPSRKIINYFLVQNILFKFNKNMLNSQ